VTARWLPPQVMAPREAYDRRAEPGRRGWPLTARFSRSRIVTCTGLPSKPNSSRSLRSTNLR
jgi:hypothetical protein